MLLQIDDEPEFRPTITVLCVSNGKFFGGGMKIAPGAKLNDGLLDIVTVGDLSRLTIFANSYRLYLGKHLGMQQVNHVHARRLTARPVDDGEVIAVETDGEIVGQLPATSRFYPPRSASAARSKFLKGKSRKVNEPAARGLVTIAPCVWRVALL